jgi:AcrR family transcriptional regulator
MVMVSKRRDHLVQTALRLFQRDGFHATGIDRIVAESGVAKMTLYKHFKSKDELILAALRRRDEEFRHWFMGAVESRASTPRERLLAIFDVLDDWFADPQFKGCTFINASSEFGDKDDPVHVTCAEHKRHVFGFVRDLTAAAGAKDPRALAMGLTLLMEGAAVMVHVAGQADAARRARQSADILVAAAIP